MGSIVMTSPECYQCNRAIEEGTPRVDLFCSHSFHTSCFCLVTWNEYRCTCGVRVLSREMEEKFRADALAKEEADVMQSFGRLKEVDGFSNDLRDLKKNIARARKARKAFYAMCRARRVVFIAETRPFVERIRDLQKDSVKGVRASPESKVAQTEYLSVRRKLRTMERKYPQFSPHRELYRKLRLPAPWEIRYTMRAVGWKVRRFFRTSPRLF